MIPERIFLFRNFWRAIFKWKKNGKCKGYNNNGKIVFEGEYLNGKKNGKCKEYNNDGIVIFEGNYFNGKKWNGKGYDKKKNIIYEVNNGKGYIKEFDNYDKLLFEGEFYKEKEMEKEKKIILMVIYYLKENI